MTTGPQAGDEGCETHQAGPRRCPDGRGGSSPCVAAPAVPQQSGRKHRRSRTAGRILALLCGFAAMPLAAVPALAQGAVERHLPPPVAPSGPALRIGKQNFGKASSAPLGVALKGVHLIGGNGAVAAHSAVGLTGVAPGLKRPDVEKALSPLLGKPLSLELARDVQAAIARLYRRAGYPFVSVTLPPQEITSGVLQVRIIRFHLGKVTVKGAGTAESKRIGAALRARPGQPIDARQIEEDIDWLNRIPYRRAEGVFAPGQNIALSDLMLDVTRKKPWQVTAGWSNGGSKATGIDRYFVGGGLWLPALNDTTIAYQLTGSADFWTDPGLGLALKGGRYAHYLGHAARIVIPTWPRQDIEIVPDFVATHQDLDAYTAVENTVFELPVIYRSAISNILPGHYWGDIYGGAEFKTLRRDTYFTGAKAAGGSASLFQFTLGWSDRIADAYGLTTIDARIKANPGGIVGGNDDATWQTFSNGRVADVRYVYGALDVTRVTRLPARFSWVSRFSGQLSDVPLPDTERLSLGGLDAVRGYDFDDAAVDRGLVWRNELRLPSFAPFERLVRQNDSLSPYVFADLGYGEDLSSDTTLKLASVGAGFDYVVGDHVSAALAAGVALNSAGATRKGDWKAQASVSFQF